MSSDEQQIRDLVATWLAASRAGDIDTVLGLMTDDVVFLVPGQAPMDKQDFAAAARAQVGAQAPTLDGHSEIEEIQIMGDWAFMCSKLSVTITPSGGGTAMRRAGHTLSVLRKEQGRWLLARDANLLAPVPGP